MLLDSPCPKTFPFVLAVTATKLSGFVVFGSIFLILLGKKFVVDSNSLNF